MKSVIDKYSNKILFKPFKEIKEFPENAKTLITQGLEKQCQDIYNLFNNIPKSSFKKLVDKLNDSSINENVEKFSTFLKSLQATKKSLKGISLDFINEEKKIIENAIKEKDKSNFKKIEDGNIIYLGQLDEKANIHGFGYYQEGENYYFIGEFAKNFHKEGILLKVVDKETHIYIGYFETKDEGKTYGFEGIFLPISDAKEEQIIRIGSIQDNFSDGFCAFKEENGDYHLYFGKSEKENKQDEKALEINFLDDYKYFSIFQGSYINGKKSGKAIQLDRKENSLFEIIYDQDNIKEANSLLFKVSENVIYNGKLNPELEIGDNGIIIWEGNHIYKGGFNSGKKHGEGIYYYKYSEENDTYQYYFKGSFQNDFIIKGDLFYSNNQLLFKGEFEKNVPKNGILYYPNKENYEGELKNDVREGKGKYTFLDKSTFEGYWKSNLKHGEGIFIDNDGDEFEGIWEDDNIKEIKRYKRKNQ